MEFRQNEFKIARNVDKTKTRELLEQTFEWINNEDPNDIDSFAVYLNNDKMLQCLNLL